MKRTGLVVVVLVVLVIFCFQAQAAEQKQGLQVKGVLDFGYYTEYTGSLSGSTIFKGSVFHQSATFSLEPIGLYFSVWDSYSPRGGPNRDFGDEVDVLFGIKRTIGKFTFNFGWGYYDYYNLKDTKGDAHGFYLVTDFPKIFGLMPFLWIEEDFNVHGGKSGFFYRGGVSHTRKIIEDLPPLNVSLSIGGHDSAFGKRAETISSSRLSFSTNLKFRKLTITPVINFQKRLGYEVRDGGVTRDRIWGGINLSIPIF